MGNLLRKGSPRPSKPFLKIKKKSASESGRTEISQGEAHRRRRTTATLRSSSSAARRGEASRNLRSHPQSCRARGNFARRGAPEKARRRRSADRQAAFEEQRSIAEFTKPEPKRELPEATPFGKQTQCRIARSVSLSNRWILETSSATMMVSPALAWLREETRAIIFCSPVTR